MSEPSHTPLSYNAALVLQALASGHPYGFEVMRASDLPSGTVYPILRRLERSGLVESRWEDESRARAEGRPARRYYEPTTTGLQTLARARERLHAQQAALFGDLAPEAPKGSSG